MWSYGAQCTMKSMILRKKASHHQGIHPPQSWHRQPGQGDWNLTGATWGRLPAGKRWSSMASVICPHTMTSWYGKRSTQPGCLISRGRRGCYWSNWELVSMVYLSVTGITIAVPMTQCQTNVKCMWEPLRALLLLLLLFFMRLHIAS